MHISGDALKYMAKHNLITGMDLSTNGDLGPCDGYTKGKHPQTPFPKKSQSRADKILQRLHMDLQGPFKGSIAGYQYVLAIIDNCSRARWKHFLKNKSDTKDEIISLITKLETFTGHKVRIIQFDGRGEFLDSNLHDWFNSKGITLEISAPDTQQQNRVAE